MGSFFSLFTGLTLSVLALSANAQIAPELQKKIVQQGVSADALSRLSKFMYENSGRSFNQDVYTCQDKPEGSVRPCDEPKRDRSSKVVTLETPQYVAIVDYTLPSSKRRFHFIDLKTGAVQSYYSSHGIGSGNGDYAYKFSNKKDSRQTSLGIYLTGEVYYGKYGKTLRMYGLQKSNDQAYNRDIVMHGAWYVGEDFMKSINNKTKEPYGRIGVSWGCPAVSTAIAAKLIPLLQGGSLIMHYHSSLYEASMSGRAVQVKEPVQQAQVKLEQPAVDSPVDPVLAAPVADQEHVATPEGEQGS